MYDFFEAIELELQKHISWSENIENKDKILEFVTSDDDVRLIWSTIAVNWDMNMEGMLMRMIVNHWVTIRGFSSTAAYNYGDIQTKKQDYRTKIKGNKKNSNWKQKKRKRY